MPMNREDHEGLLNELLTPDLEMSRRTEILTTLRNDYTTVITDHTDHTGRIDKLTKDNQDLIVSNSKLFRQIGLTEDSKKVEDQKSVSESITIEDLEKL